MCGATGSHVFEGQFCKDTTGTSDATKTTTCAKAKNGISIGMDIVCMCTANTHDKCATGASDYTGGSTTIKADAIKAFTNECPGAGAEIELTTAIDEALTAARTAIVYDGTGGADKKIIGKAAGNSCAAATDWCVDYSDYYNKEKGFDQIPWVAHLLEIAKLYKEYTKHLAEKAVIKSQLEALRDRVRIEYTRARPEKNYCQHRHKEKQHLPQKVAAKKMSATNTMSEKTTALKRDAIMMQPLQMAKNVNLKQEQKTQQQQQEMELQEEQQQKNEKIRKRMCVKMIANGKVKHDNIPVL
uniref:Variant surface glycoprotein 1125.5480 n=1 Tax=Trypanosoma brucei TaxID=5691 RepID=A0A1J0RC90_9TRYP|nr:variant surface glycoprotein 1125.5480 [Trypanosoma brucei]